MSNDDFITAFDRFKQTVDHGNGNDQLIDGLDVIDTFRLWLNSWCPSEYARSFGTWLFIRKFINVWVP